MRRTQLFLDDDLWQALRLEAQRQGETVSELARRALREKYASEAAQRRQAMLSWIGAWKNRSDVAESDAFVRRLRRGRRLERKK